MKKKSEKNLKPLQLNKETLHRLESPELRKADGGASLSYCFATYDCCDYW